MSRQEAGVGVAAKHKARILFSCAVTSAGTIISRCGQCSSDCRKKLGPHHYTSLLARSAAEIPWVGRSAGFSTPGTCCHCLLVVDMWIVATQVATSVLN